MSANGSIKASTFNSPALDRFTIDATSQCPSYSDPHEEVLASLNKLVVYGGLVASRESAEYLTSRMDPGLEVNGTTMGYLTGVESVYHTDFRFFVAAIVVELICVALVAPTYWNWWKLERAMSFSPLEIAKAFESPLLADCNSNSSGRDMARKMNDTRIQYGVVASHDSSEKGKKLAFASPEVVEKPRTGMLIDI